MRYLLPLLFGLFMTTLPAQVLINEYSAANHMQFINNFQEHDDWIELFNTSDTPIDLKDWGITDNPNQLGKWKFKATTMIAAKGFIRLWCNGRDTTVGTQYHTNFKITQTKKNPEKLTLTNPAGVIQDQVEVKKTARHQSRGRKLDGDPEWMICTTPTIRSTNNTAARKYKRFLDRPKMSVEGGFFDNSVTVQLSSNEENARIHYTTNGTEPTNNDPIYNAPLTFTQTTVLKARVYNQDTLALPSFIEFHTYFINVNHTLEVVSISADQLLTLANGDNTRTPRGSMEYFGKNKKLIDKVYGELNSHGQDSWENDQRSLDWITRDEFGYTDKIEHQIFKGSPRDEFQRIILRASGDDNYPAANRSSNEGCAHIRDEYVQTLASLANLRLDTRRVERCIVYLNGNYWGVYAFREKVDDHDYMKEYYDQDRYRMQMVMTWGDTWAEYGGAKSIADWRALRSYILNNDMRDSSKFALVGSQLDFLSLIDYFFVNQQSVCSDWLNYNTSMWRGIGPTSAQKKWRYTLWDNDATYGFYINYTGIPDTTPYARHCDIDNFNDPFISSDPELHIQVINKLRTNPTFDQLYLSRHTDMLNTTYSCASLLRVLDSLVAVIDPEMTMHANRWSGNYTHWKQNISRLRFYIERRCDNAFISMLECDSLGGPYRMHFRTEPLNVGTIRVNTLPPTDNPYTGAYFGKMYHILGAAPLPASGYVFSHWRSKYSDLLPDTSLSEIKAYFNRADTIVAVFKPATVSTSEPAQKWVEMLNVSVNPTFFDQEIAVRVQLTEPKPVEILITNTLGTVIHKQALPKTELVQERITLPAGLASGMYFLRVRSGNQTRLIKLVKAGGS